MSLIFGIKNNHIGYFPFIENEGNEEEEEDNISVYSIFQDKNPSKASYKEGHMLHTALMLPVCHGFGGKVPSYGEWKAGHQEEGLYCINM